MVVVVCVGGRLEVFEANGRLTAYDQEGREGPVEKSHGGGCRMEEEKGES